MAWQKSSQALEKRHAELALRYPCERRTMFGFQVFLVNGNMFTGLFENAVTLRLSPQDREEIQAQHDEITPFKPMGRLMREYVLVPDVFWDSDEFATQWLRRSFEFVAAMPVKEKKPAKEKKTVAQKKSPNRP